MFPPLKGTLEFMFQSSRWQEVRINKQKKKKTPKCLLTKQNKRLVYEQLFSPALSNQNLIFEPSSHIACLKPECTSCYWSNNYNIGLVANHNYYSQKVDKWNADAHGELAKFHYMNRKLVQTNKVPHFDMDEKL